MYLFIGIAVFVMLLVLLLSVMAISKGYAVQEKVDQIDEWNPKSLNEKNDL